MFEDLIKNGVEFRTTTGSRFIITNHPEKNDINIVKYINVITDVEYKKEREVIEKYIRSGYWRENIPLDSETHR